MLDGERTNVAQQLPRGEAIARLNDKLRTTARGGSGHPSVLAPVCSKADMLADMTSHRGPR